MSKHKKNKALRPTLPIPPKKTCEIAAGLLKGIIDRNPAWEIASELRKVYDYLYQAGNISLQLEPDFDIVPPVIAQHVQDVEESAPE